MEDVTFAHAKEHLEELVERAARGEELRIVDARLGTVKLIAAGGPGQPCKPRRLGLLEGKIKPPPDDFFEPMGEEELKLWYGD